MRETDELTLRQRKTLVHAMKKLIRRSLMTGLMAMLSTAQAGDWPQWRGLHRDGISSDTGLLKQWPQEGPALAWKATGIGGGYSTPSVAAGCIYGAGYKEGGEIIWALDATTGKEIWRTKVAPAFMSMGYPEGPRATPTKAITIINPATTITMPIASGIDQSIRRQGG